jgi:hypothetical protein
VIDLLRIILANKLGRLARPIVVYGIDGTRQAYNDFIIPTSNLNGRSIRPADSGTNGAM